MRVPHLCFSISSAVLHTTIGRRPTIPGRSNHFIHAHRKDTEYSPAVPIETFDFIITDECHRSIYNLRAQVLEYFDAFLIGLTATPSKQTIGFFRKNLVMEYKHEEAVADAVNVDFDVYRIRTRITEGGPKVDAGLCVDKRDRLTQARRWEQLDEDLDYGASQLDRDVVANDQMRTVNCPAGLARVPGTQPGPRPETNESMLNHIFSSSASIPHSSVRQKRGVNTVANLDLLVRRP